MAVGRIGKPRNKPVAGARSVMEHGRAKMSKLRAVHKRKKVSVPRTVEKVAEYKEKEINGEKNGGKRMVLLKKKQRYYPTEDRPKRLPSNKRPKSERKPRVRGAIKPGNVLILLAGNNKGKRVVYLKQLDSGLLLVTGPYKYNRVPLRRVDQAYVIATSTRLDISKVDIPETLNDKFFKKIKLNKRNIKKKSEDLFGSQKETYQVSEERKEAQNVVDGQLLPIVDSEPFLKEYLGCRFSLSSKQYPHLMKF